MSLACNVWDEKKFNVDVIIEGQLKEATCVAETKSHKDGTKTRLCVIFLPQTS